jgi:hypothetical protein
LSRVEEAILKSEHVPIEIDELSSAQQHEISVIGQRGVWMNRRETEEWRGPVSLDSYEINQDGCPLIVNKKTGQCVEYVQELAVRYLRPLTPPAPGLIPLFLCSNKK